MVSDKNRSGFDTAVVLGGAGAVGRLFCQRLLDSGVKRVVSVDRSPQSRSPAAAEDDRKPEYVCADACAADEAVQNLTAVADLVIIALPSEPAEKCLADQRRRSSERRH